MTTRPARPLLALLAAALTVLLCACGPPEQRSDDAPTAEGDESGESGADAAAFPVTIEHRLGKTTIPAPPERVFTVGWNDQDFVLSLGVVPVGTRAWFDEYSDYPWVSEVTGGEELMAIEDINYEQIAAARPDVIVAIYEEFDEGVYDKLSRIAPTVLQPAEYGKSAPPWDVQLEITAQALGRDAEAAALIQDVEARIELAKAENPQFAEQTLVVDYGPEDDGHWLVPAGDPRRSLFDQLGFAAQEHSKELSGERLDLLEEDVLVVFGATEGDLTSPTFTALDVVTEDRTLYVGWDATLSGAMSYSGPQALLYALDQVVPQLAAAADGDPTTEVGVLD